MPITAAQVQAFLTNDIGLDPLIVQKLSDDGIDNVDDLAEFDAESLRDIQRGINKLQDVIAANVKFGQKSLMRLTVAAEAVRHYNAVGRALTPAMIRWDPTLKNFKECAKALKSLADQDHPETPRIQRNLPIIKWVPAFRMVLKSCFGSVPHLSLLYVLREDPVPAGPISALATGQPYGSEYGSLHDELIARASHATPAYDLDNQAVLSKLEEATRGTELAGTIAPFVETGDGRGAYKEIMAQHLGEDKWDKEIRKHDEILHGRKWKGTGNEKFVALHLNSFQRLTEASQHIAFQLPNGHTRVGYLLSAIHTTDA